MTKLSLTVNGRTRRVDAGQPACAIVPSVIAGAIYDAVGVRLRTVPFKPADVLAALKA
jgi:nicotinate dehydrogenase subunit B